MTFEHRLKEQAPQLEGLTISVLKVGRHAQRRTRRKFADYNYKGKLDMTMNQLNCYVYGNQSPS